MFAYEPPLDPPCDEWKEYRLPELCRMKIFEICHDILKRGEKTIHNDIYDAIYELVEADVEDDHINHGYEF